MRKSCKRKVRPINIPMTGLVTNFAKELHFGLMAAEVGAFNKQNFDRIGAALNVIWAALYNQGDRFKQQMAVVEGGMAAMNDCAKRGDATGVWQLRNFEQLAVAAAISKAEEVLPLLTVNEMHKAMVDTHNLANELMRKAA